MSHLHIPDGVLPVWLWLTGLLFMILLLALALRRIRKADLRKKLPLLAFAAAMMLVSMSLEIVPLAYHMNLSVLTGILLGPAMGFVAAFLVNFMLALVGHGGLTVVGLNTLIIGFEACSGYWLFRVFKRLFKTALAGGLSVVLTLFLSTSLVIGLAALSRLDPLKVSEFAGRDRSEEKGLLSFHGSHHHEDQHKEEAGKTTVSLATFAKGAYILGSIGWILEALLVGFILRFLVQVKPDMIST